MNGHSDEWTAWDVWMRSRPQRKNYQLRFFSELDSHVPNWEAIHAQPGFAAWLAERNIYSGKTRLDLIRICSKENYDAYNTAHFYTLFENRGRGLSPRIDTDSSRRVGTLIGNRYEIIRPIGSGAFGSVYFVYSHELNEFEALKMLRTDIENAVEAIADFKKEANVWTEVGLHPNVLRAHFVDRIDEQFCVVMEYVAPDAHGRVTLRDWLTHGPLQPADVCRFALNICDGMATAFARGLKAHRDLKPENILISESGTAKVSDFGLAGVVPVRAAGARTPAFPGVDATVVGALMGTPWYIAPEAIIDSSQADQTTDIYSFGVILYELLSGGQWPYDHPSGSRPLDAQRFVLDAHLRAKPKRLWHALNGLVQRCLSKDRSRRPQTFSDVRKEVASWALRKRIPHFAAPAAPQENFWDKGRRASSLYRLGRFREALAIFDTLQHEFGDDLTIFNIALCQTALGEIDAAIATYHRLLDRDKSHTGALINLAGLLARQNQLPEAEALLHRVLAIDDTESVAHVGLGNLYYKRHDYVGASLEYQAALKHHPSDPTGWHNLALAALAVGDRPRAREALSGFLDYAAPDDARIDFAKKKLRELIDP